MTELTRGTWAVEVKATTDPDGRRAVLLQLPHGFVVMNARDALHVAASLVEVVDEMGSHES